MKRCMTLLLFVASLAFAQAQVPEQVMKMNDLPNAGALFLEYCAGNKCVTRMAICYGQCCSQESADDSGYACYGDIEGYVPRGYKYSGWHCSMYNQNDNPPEGIKGKAGKVDPCPGEPNKNRRYR